MNTKFITAVFLSMWVFIYLSVAFVQWQLDPSEWGEATRFMFVLFGFTFSICAAGLAANEELV